MKNIIEFIVNFLKCLFSNKKNNRIMDSDDVIEKNNIENKVIEISENIEPMLSVPKTRDNIKILIDNGHGDSTLGKRSPYSCNGIEPAIEFYEYQWNREIAGEIVNRLKSMGYNADLLVTENSDISLSERVRRVNYECDIYGKSNVMLISVHANASGNGDKWMTAKGWSAYTTKGKTNSDKLADYLYNEAEKNFIGRKIRVDMQDGDRDWESDFYLCQKTKCPAVLTENFFYDNVDDVQYILSEEGRNAVIKTHVNGIINYIKNEF